MSTLVLWPIRGGMLYAWPIYALFRQYFLYNYVASIFSCKERWQKERIEYSGKKDNNGICISHCIWCIYNDTPGYSIWQC